MRRFLCSASLCALVLATPALAEEGVAGGGLVSTSGRSIRLRIHGNYLVTVTDKSLERRNRCLRSAHEYDLHKTKLAKQ